MKHTQRGERFLGASGVARILGVHRSTIDRWFKRAVLPTVEINGRRRISVRALEKWRDENGDGEKVSR